MVRRMRAAILAALEWSVGLAVIVARERFQGPDFDRLARAEWLVQDAISYRIEHARRGLYQSL